MTQLCIVGDEEVTLQYELLSRETARDALSTYDLREPFANTVAVETVSLGSAVSLLNDLNWYLVRFAETAFVREPSVDEEEWLSRDLATAVRDDRIRPEETDRYVAVYGVEPSEEENAPPRLVEPMFAARTGGEIPEYDLRELSDTVVVRLTADEYGA
jgi:hypothetical protein